MCFKYQLKLQDKKKEKITYSILCNPIILFSNKVWCSSKPVKSVFTISCKQNLTFLTYKSATYNFKHCPWIMLQVWKFNKLFDGEKSLFCCLTNLLTKHIRKMSISKCLSQLMLQKYFSLYLNFCFEVYHGQMFQEIWFSH